MDDAALGGVEQIQQRYATAAAAVGSTGETGLVDASEAGVFGATLYDDTDTDAVPPDAVAASLACGNPVEVVDLRPGEVVLDLGSGGGLDVLLSARRVGPMGYVYGLDMTDEMLALARRNAAEAGAQNVEFLRGRIEAVPLPDASVDVVISNCVITLSADKPSVFREMARVLRPGGRVGLSDIVAADDLSDEERAAAAGRIDGLATSLTAAQYREALGAAGLTNVDIRPTHRAGPKLLAAIIRATRP